MLSISMKVVMIHNLYKNRSIKFLWFRQHRLETLVWRWNKCRSISLCNGNGWMRILCKFFFTLFIGSLHIPWLQVIWYSYFPISGRKSFFFFSLLTLRQIRSKSSMIYYFNTRRFRTESNDMCTCGFIYDDVLLN